MFESGLLGLSQRVEGLHQDGVLPLHLLELAGVLVLQLDGTGLLAEFDQLVCLKPEVFEGGGLDAGRMPALPGVIKGSARS